MNHLVVIGWMGVKRCYLNVSREEAVRRYTEHGGMAPDDEHIEEFDFNDEFGAYDAWSI